jgi:N-methylhydantoinase B
MRSRKILGRVDGSREDLPSKCDHVKVAEGDALHYITWGGGGWGDPLERDPGLVAREVDRGLVTADGARRYGVVLTDGSAIDEAATAALRERMRADRGAVEVFDFGASIDELRARSLEETGLPAPQPPVFVR